MDEHWTVIPESPEFCAFRAEMTLLKPWMPPRRSWLVAFRSGVGAEGQAPCPLKIIPDTASRPSHSGRA